MPVFSSITLEVSRRPLAAGLLDRNVRWRSHAESPHKDRNMTFDELFSEHNITPEEREALVMYLAMLRSTATIKALLGRVADLEDAQRRNSPAINAAMRFVPLGSRS